VANAELTKALHRAHNVKTPKAVEDADGEIKERMFLIGNLDELTPLTRLWEAYPFVMMPVVARAPSYSISRYPNLLSVIAPAV